MNKKNNYKMFRAKLIPSIGVAFLLIERFITRPAKMGITYCVWLFDYEDRLLKTMTPQSRTLDADGGANILSFDLWKDEAKITVNDWLCEDKDIDMKQPRVGCDEWFAVTEVEECLKDNRTLANLVRLGCLKKDQLFISEWKTPELRRKLEAWCEKANNSQFRLSEKE